MRKNRLSCLVLGMGLIVFPSFAQKNRFNDDKIVTPANQTGQSTDAKNGIAYNGSTDAEAMHKRYLEVVDRIKTGKGPTFLEVLLTFINSITAGTVSNTSENVQKTYANSVDQGMVFEMAMSQAKSAEEKKRLGQKAAASFAQAGDAALKRGDPYMARMFYKKGLAISTAKEVKDPDMAKKIRARLTAFDSMVKEAKKSMDTALANYQKLKGSGAKEIDLSFAKEKYEWARKEYERVTSTEFVK
jgi:tetratricopeptide (TPR) repeat protein